METKQKTLLQTILGWAKPVSWNNKFVKPEGYEYDEDGIIETSTPQNFITTNTIYAYTIVLLSILSGSKKY